RNAQIVLGLGVIGLQVGILDWPIGQRCPGNVAENTALLEIAFVKPPIVRGEVNAASAHLPSVHDGLNRLGLFRFALAICDRLQLGIVGQPCLVGVSDLIVFVIFFGEVR